MQRRMYRIVSVAALFASMASLAHAQWTWTPQTRRWINLKNLPKETAELQVEYARSLMLEGNYQKAIRETNKFSNFYSDSELADQNQFLRGEIRMAQGKYEDAAKQFQQVVATYPDSDLFGEVIAKEYEVGDKLYARGQSLMKKHWRLFRKKPFKQAIEVYGMVIQNQPFTDAAAEAQYKIGLCHFTREEYVEAAFEYRHLMESYASSDWVDDACYGLAECYYDSSLPPQYDQGPSKLAVAAIDDFKTRFPGDARGAGLDDQRKEMRERIAQQRLQTGQFYEKRREFDSARIYYEVLVEQFSETSAAEKAREWLAKNPAKEVEPTFHTFEAANVS